MANLGKLDACPRGSPRQAPRSDWVLGWGSSKASECPEERGPGRQPWTWEPGFRKIEALVKITGAHTYPHHRKRLSVTGPPSQQPFQTRRPSLKAAVARSEGLNVKSQSLSAVEFDNRGFPRQPRSRGDQELVLAPARPRENSSRERMMTDASDLRTVTSYSSMC